MNGINPYAFLQTLKPGDKVIIRLYGGGPPIVEEVEKVNQISVVVNGTRFRKTNGKEIGRTENLEYAATLVEWSEETERRAAELFARQLDGEDD